MNKKLFFAGFALLAAVSFTSCNSDNPIDVTDPNGVKPASSTHYLGGSYDWTAVAKDYDQLKEFWAADKNDVKDAIKDKKTINILLDVSGYTLANETIEFPDFWKFDGTGAKGKVVNITITGNFKNADFERANAIAKNDVAADMSKFPVKLDTKNLKGAEVNFTFNVEKFDLYLASTLTRSTFSGAYTIGYMKAQTATKLSALEVKEGIVEGLDVESTGDYKGSIDGVWTRTAQNEIVADGNGLYAWIYDATTVTWTRGITIPGATDVFIEKNADISPYYWNGSDNVPYALGTVKFVQKDNTNATVWMNQWIGGASAPYTIETIQGKGANRCFVTVGQNTLNNVEAVNKVTIQGTPTLKSDVFTDVTFNGIATFNTKDVAAFDNVQFNNPRIIVGADNTELSFANVTFARPFEITVLSGINVTNAADYYTYDYYQWVISDAAANLGKWVIYKSENGLPVADDKIKEYNKGKDVVEFDINDAWVDAAGDLQTAGWWINTSAATNLIKIGTYHPELVAYVIPENVTFNFDSKCKFYNDYKGAVDSSDRALNYSFGHKDDSKDTWYDVIFGGKAYSWKKVNYGGTPAAGSTTTIYWDLVPPTE